MLIATLKKLEHERKRKNSLRRKDQAKDGF